MKSDNCYSVSRYLKLASRCKIFRAKMHALEKENGELRRKLEETLESADDGKPIRTCIKSDSVI